jgi:hypothetical protein
VSKILPKYQRFERCTLTDIETDEERGFRIGQECFPANQLCKIQEAPENMLTRFRENTREWGYHPQHIAICQNLTFWKDQRRNTRKYIFCFTINVEEK